MPSTAWNVFVTSGVAIVVYFAAKMGQVLLGLAAGTILFLGGWLTGYAINHDLLDSIGLLRVGAAGVVSGFVVFWTVVVEEGEFLTGMIVMGLVWFAAWFTSEMGPVKGERGAMATIDEPKPPEGPRPGTPVDLGGDADATRDTGGSSGVLGKLRGVITPSDPAPPTGADAKADTPDPEGPSSDELAEHGDAGDDATYTTRETEPAAAPSGEKESIFGLGIFYEGDPNGTPAGADTDDSEPPATEREPKDGDHTRPGASDPRPESDDAADDADETDDSVEIEVDSDDEPADDGWTEADPDEDSEREERLREPQDSPTPPGKSPATDTGYDLYRGDGSASEAGGDSETRDEAESRDAEDAEDDPPEEHRVDVDDDGFIFG